MRVMLGEHDLLESCAMSEHHLMRTRILARWRGGPVQTPPLVHQDLRRSISPEARMNLLLRFETESGPRTIVAPGVLLPVASEIALAMERAGHFAEFVDHI